MSRHAKGSVIVNNGAYRWRHRHGRRETTEFLGRVEDFKSKRAAEAFRDQLWAERNPIASSHGTTITMMQLASLYDKLCIKPSRKKSSARSIRSRLFKHIVPFFCKVQLARIDALKQQEFIAHLVGQGLGRHTIDAVLSTLSKLLIFARKGGHSAPKLDRDLLDLPPEGAADDERWFPPEDSLRIIGAAPWPWRCIFAFAALLGLRCGEVLALRWSDIDLAKRLVNIERNAVVGIIDSVKSKNSRAQLPMPPRLIDEVQVYWDEVGPADTAGRDLLFARDDGRPYTNNQACAALRGVLSALGIPRAGMHAFRHGVVTLLLNEGVPIHVVRAIVRHGRIETTQRYSHAQAESLRIALNTGLGVLNWGSNGVAGAAHSSGNNRIDVEIQSQHSGEASSVRDRRDK